MHTAFQSAVAAAHLVSHEQPLLYAPEDHPLLLQLAVNAADGLACCIMVLDQVKYVLQRDSIMQERGCTRVQPWPVIRLVKYDTVC
jgi:hypothetical protein